MREKNEIRLEQHGKVTFFDIRGDVTILSEPFINEAYEKVNRPDISKILLEFEESAYINSGGISILIQILSKTKKNNQEIGITGLSEHFKKIFNMVGITKFAHIYNTREEAVDRMS